MLPWYILDLIAYHLLGIQSRTSSVIHEVCLSIENSFNVCLLLFICREMYYTDPILKEKFNS
jgi:hypothetical protein